MSLRLQAIHLHSVKSTAIRPVPYAGVDALGLTGDRRRMVADRAGEWVTARQLRALFRVVGEPRRRPARPWPGASAGSTRAPISLQRRTFRCTDFGRTASWTATSKPLPRDTCGTVEVGEVSRQVDVVGYAVDTRRCRWYQGGRCICAMT
ncbi:MAG TPA: MOSC N-terminal beta barrel domain-containing protein [Tetrasphaera sp.]|nr:MOSC N-terminal beta barrel domain-containing protein [Tetrasphaera sp.]